jgi:hypothetical protein
MKPLELLTDKGPSCPGVCATPQNRRWFTQHSSTITWQILRRNFRINLTEIATHWVRSAYDDAVQKFWRSTTFHIRVHIPAFDPFNEELRDTIQHLLGHIASSTDECPCEIEICVTFVVQEPCARDIKFLATPTAADKLRVLSSMSDICVADGSY